MHVIYYTANPGRLMKSKQYQIEFQLFYFGFIPLVEPENIVFKLVFLLPVTFELIE